MLLSSYVQLLLLLLLLPLLPLVLPIDQCFPFHLASLNISVCVDVVVTAAAAVVVHSIHLFSAIFFLLLFYYSLLPFLVCIQCMCLSTSFAIEYLYRTIMKLRMNITWMENKQVSKPTESNWLSCVYVHSHVIYLHGMRKSKCFHAFWLVHHKCMKKIDTVSIDNWKKFAMI